MRLRLKSRSCDCDSATHTSVYIYIILYLIRTSLFGFQKCADTQLNRSVALPRIETHSAFFIYIYAHTATKRVSMMALHGGNYRSNLFVYMHQKQPPHARRSTTNAARAQPSAMCAMNHVRTQRKSSSASISNRTAASSYDGQWM